MTKNEIFDLYKLVQHKDKNAINKLIAYYLEVYPRQRLNVEYGLRYNRPEQLHTMYLHLYR